MENKKNGSAVKNKNFNLSYSLAENAKSEATAQQSNAVQKKKQSNPVDVMAANPVTDNVTDALGK